MRRFGVLLIIVAIWIGLSGVGHCQDGQEFAADFAIGALNGPALEMKGDSWLIQGAWLLYFIDDEGFDTGYVLRADYVMPLEGMTSGSGVPAEFAFGYTFIDIDDDAGNSFSENGINAQYIYYFQPNISFRVGYDYFLDPDQGSIQDLWTAGLMYHF